MRLPHRFTLNCNKDLQRLTPSTIQRLSTPFLKSNIYNPQSPARTLQLFPQTIVHTDGSTYTVNSCLPNPRNIKLVKDTIHHPVWNIRMSQAQVDESSEEFVKFKSKFITQDSVDASGRISEDVLADLAFDSNPVIVPKKVVPVVVAPVLKKKKRK